MIIFEAGLSFTGAGVQEPTAHGRQIVLSGGWCATFFPSPALRPAALTLNDRPLAGPTARA